jgi:glutamate formiminotransferase/formiminotetrahydrofolate cyclodeaminase
LVDEDTRAFNQILTAFSLPKETPEEKIARSQAIQAATRFATETPLRTMELAFEVFELAAEMVRTGNPNSVTDAAVGALCANAAVKGAFLNVKINATSLKDAELASSLLGRAAQIAAQAADEERKILELTEQKM